MGTLFLGALAGALTTLSPCVLPILPFVVLAALDQHRYGPFALAVGMIVTFTGAGLLFAGAGRAFDVPADSIRSVSAALMALFGALLLSAAPKDRLAAFGAPVTAMFNRALERFSPTGIRGQFALGALLGVVWAPCSGPTLGAAVTLAANSETMVRAATIMLLFGVGASMPLLAIAYGSRQTLKARRDTFLRIEHAARPVLGAVLLAGGLLVLTGIDKTLEAVFVTRMPDWLVTLTTRF